MASVRPPPNTIIGRTAELGAIDGFLDLVATGLALLLLEGEPGIGKSTLLTEGLARVAALIASGRTYKEAADEVFISPKTVQWNLSKVYRKLGIRSRAELPTRLATETRPDG